MYWNIVLLLLTGDIDRVAVGNRLSKITNFLTNIACGLEFVLNNCAFSIILSDPKVDDLISGSSINTHVGWSVHTSDHRRVV